MSGNGALGGFGGINRDRFFRWTCLTPYILTQIKRLLSSPHDVNREMMHECEALLHHDTDAVMKASEVKSTLC